MSCFLSDNVAGAHPAVVQAVLAANTGSAAPYGDDDLSRRLDAAFSELLERDVAVIPCTTGTAANALALSLVAGPTGAICAHEGSHVYGDECNAPEFFTGGARMTPVAGTDGKLTQGALTDAVARRGDRHAAQPAAVTLAQATEMGTVYTLSELEGLSSFARDHGLCLHMDGARFANAVAALGCTPAEMTWRAGVDVLSFGGTKNGCFLAEAVVLFDPGLAEQARFRAKRAGQLASKMRFVSAQLLASLEDGLWLETARHANATAKALADRLSAAGIEVPRAPEANMVYARMPKRIADRLQTAGLAGYFDGKVMRLCTSWNTRPSDINHLLDCVETALSESAE
jgi:threonine aldolase